MHNLHNIKKVEQGLKEIIYRLPKQIGAEAVRFSKESWRRQGWQGATFEPWQKRRGGKNNRGRAILVRSGRLRRSVRVLRATTDSVVIGTDVPYAAAHNNGFRGTVNVKVHKRNRYKKTRTGTGIYSVKTKKERTRTVSSYDGAHWVQSHTRTMRIPKRQFIGESPYMEAKIKRLIAAEVLKAARRI